MCSHPSLCVVRMINMGVLFVHTQIGCLDFVLAMSNFNGFFITNLFSDEMPELIFNSG